MSAGTKRPQIVDMNERTGGEGGESQEPTRDSEEQKAPEREPARGQPQAADARSRSGGFRLAAAFASPIHLKH